MGSQSSRTYWVYIMTNRSGTLYTGFTGDLARRVNEHRHHLIHGFSSRNKTDRLVHAEAFSNVNDAIAREKAIKGWLRAKKLALISEANPDWKDLRMEWFGPID
jgi:putative endonuclease